MGNYNDFSPFLFPSSIPNLSSSASLSSSSMPPSPSQSSASLNSPLEPYFVAPSPSNLSFVQSCASASAIGPCAACKILDRQCSDKCFASNYSPTESEILAILNKLFGAEDINVINIIKERKSIVDELIKGKELAAQLSDNLNSPERHQLLVEKVLSSYDKTLCLLNWPTSQEDFFFTLTSNDPGGLLLLMNQSAPPAPAPPLPPSSLNNPLLSSQPNSSDYAAVDSAELGSGAAGDEPARTLRFVWTPQLHKRFVEVVAHLGIKSAIPETIMQLMSVNGLTRENIASHLQKYRLYLKRNYGLYSGGGGGVNGNDGSPASAANAATKHLFATSPVPPHFLHPGRPNSEHYLSSDPVAALKHHYHHQQMAAAVGHPQYHRQMGQLSDEDWE